ncbi:glycosyltransferase [Bradyrhizobium sp. SSUT18]|uniref:glycosyltransferase n=1 Tax=Bradyrhizobium sp. SSUT18 TaxID=3040602 RepID=UPI00244A135D|nr:glycosyltransferase [Bradyrhizobium sp. SSUT18]MDH2406106.1 glycosyltransferase [Bradyrhizobium sp. SSUT18]
MRTKKTVLVYRNELLPVSETFIKEQILALRDWRAVLVGRKKVNQLPLDSLDVRLIGPASTGLFDALLWKSQQALGVVPPHVKRVLARERPSLIHAHFGVDALDAWPLARALNLPMLVTLHGYDINTHREWWEAGKGGSDMHRYPTHLLELAKQPRVGFIAVSEAIRRRAIEFGIAAEKVFVRYIGIDSSRFAPGPVPIDQRPARVLFVGRLVEKKGCRYLIQAVAQVQENVPGCELIIIGDGPLREELEQLARSLRVSATFLGARSNGEVKHEMDNARVFCLPSVTAESGDAEGLPISILEAQASGIPVITSARGGVGEAVRDELSGLTFAEGDVSALASKLRAILVDDDRARELAAETARFVASSFDIRPLTAKLEALYSFTASQSERVSNLSFGKEHAT